MPWNAYSNHQEQVRIHSILGSLCHADLGSGISKVDKYTGVPRVALLNFYDRKNPFPLESYVQHVDT